MITRNKISLNMEQYLDSGEPGRNYATERNNRYQIQGQLTKAIMTTYYEGENVSKMHRENIENGPTK